MKNILAILILTIFIFGCHEDSSELPIDLPYLTLTSPLDTTVDYCDVELKWESNIIHSFFIVEVSTDSIFQNVVINESVNISSNTLIDANHNYTINGNLEPNKTFYWRIIIGNDIKIGSFTTTDESDLQDFTGTFPMNIYYYHPGEPDTTWQDTLQISFVNDIPQLVGSSGNVIVQPDFFESSTNCYELFYREFPNPGDPTVVVANRCTLDLQNRTFRFYKGHPSNHFDIYTEYTGSID